MTDTADASSAPRVLHATVAGIELNDEQKAAIRKAAGVDVEWLLFTHSTDHVARSLGGNALAVTKLTWCW